MAIAKVQQKEALTAANATSQAITLDNPPAADNILWLGISGDKNTGSIATWAATNSWNVICDNPSTSVTLYLLWKVSAGTEQTITPAWGSASLAGSTVWYSEWSDSAVAGGNWLVPTSASHITDETTATTWTTGTTGTVSGANAKALAVAAMDSGQSITTSRDAWGSSFIAEFDPSALSGRGGFWAASLDAPAGSTYSSSFNFTGTADQISAAIAVFRKAATGAPTLNENVSHPANSLFRLRFEVQETGGVAVASAFQLRFSKNGGAYTQVTTATDVRPAPSGQFADGAATTDLLPSGTGTFVAGVGEEADAVTPSVSLGASGHTELEFALTIFTGTVGDTFDFRVYKNDGTALDSYAVTPRVTAAAAGGAQALAGTSAGTSTSTGDLTVAHTLAGSSAGTSTSTGALSVARPLAGSSAGTSTSTGDVKVAHSLNGTSAGTATSTGDLNVFHTLAGTSTGTSASTGDVAVSHPLAGTSTGTSTSTGDLTLVGQQPLAGTSAGTSTSTGNLTVAHTFAGTSAGTSTSTGNLAVAHPLAGTSTGSSSSTGDLILVKPLAGTSAGTSASTGTLSIARSLAGTSAGASTSTGALRVTYLLAGTSTGTGTSTGDVRVAVTLAGVSAGLGISTGDLTVTGQIVAVGRLEGGGTLTAMPDGTGTVVVSESAGAVTVVEGYGSVSATESAGGVLALIE